MMFPSFMVVPLHFTIEFLGFLVASGACLLVLSRPQLVAGPAFNRISAALGFASLAVVQVLHGGAFHLEGVFDGQFDGDELVVALRALGLAFILVGIAGTMRAAPTALAAYQLRDPLLLAPAGASFLLALLCVAGSMKRDNRPLRRLAAAAFLFGVAEILIAGAPETQIGQGEPNPYVYGSHVVKVFAYAALAWWLWSGVRLSIRSRFVASFVALLVGVVLTLSTTLTGVISSNVERQEKSRVRGQIENVARTIEGRDTSEVLTKAQTLAGSIRSSGGLFAPGSNVAALASAFRTQIPTLAEDFLLLLNRNGQIVSAAGEQPTSNSNARPRPLSRTDYLRIIGSGVVRDVLRGEGSAASLDRVGDAVAIVAAVEILHPTNPSQRDGIVVTGRYVDALTVAEISNSLKPAKASLLVEGQVLASDLPGDPAARQLVPTRLRPLISAESAEPQRLTLGDRSFYSGYAALESANGDLIATLVLSSPERIVIQTREAVTRTLFLVAMAVALVALLLAWLSGRRITRPIQALTQTAQAVREGDLSARARVVGEDEVGQLGETFNEMTTSLLRMTNDLREAAREEHGLRARIETIIQSMADGLVAVDADVNVLAFNREAEKLTGIKAEDALGKSVDKVLDARDAEGRKISLPIHNLSEGAVTGVFLARRKGEPLPVAFTSAVLRGEDGEVAGAVAVLRDMTREREIERMKSEFLSNISHELRTPLTPIKGYAEILERKNLAPEKHAKFVKGILDSTARLERIVELLVDFSALEAGRLAPRNTPVELDRVIERLVGDWAGRSTKHNIVTEVNPRLPKVVGDERLLRRSLEEVLDNAIKFSPAGGTIRLVARGATSKNGQQPVIDRRRTPRAVEVSVVDPGIGIPPEDLPSIFSDFHQLDGSETRAYGGLGLGLAFVQRIVEAHDGSVRVESEPEKGTKLTITIPAATARKGR